MNGEIMNVLEVSVNMWCIWVPLSYGACLTHCLSDVSPSTSFYTLGDLRIIFPPALLKVDCVGTVSIRLKLNAAHGSNAICFHLFFSIHSLTSTQ